MPDIFIGQEENLAAVSIARVFRKFTGKGFVIQPDDIPDIVEERQYSGFWTFRLEEDESGAG